MKVQASATVMLLVTLLMTCTVNAMSITGKVVDSAGKPLPWVRIRLSDPDAVPFSTAVFTTPEGKFSAQVSYETAEKIAIDVFRIGWKETARNIDTAAAGMTVNVTMEAIANVAHQVPSSAWLQGDTDSLSYQMATLHCSNCHQLGGERIRRFSSNLAGIPVDERSEAWLKRSVEDLSWNGKRGVWKEREDIPPHERVVAWESMVQYMRLVTMQLGEEKKLRWGIKEGSEFYNALLQPETSLFVPRDMEIVVPNLALNFPVDFDTYTGYDDIERLGEYGVAANTVIDEFVLPTFGWTREIAIAPGSSHIWFLETDKDRLGSLDPADGSVTWYPVPGEGQQGPHTMNADAQGNLWIALEDSFNIARFNTRTKEWRLYPPPEGKVFGVTHDFAFNSNRHVQPDSTGRIWITDLGMNELWGINVDSGKIDTYKMPLAVGETDFHSLLYGAVFDAERDRVWWSQLYGYAGSFDVVNNVVERIIPFERGAGPRRLAIEEDGTVWIPLNGRSELVKFDSIKGLEIARYTIPDPGAAPYGVTLDKKRNAIWAATSNTDRIYRFDIETEKWTHYPLPRKESFIRMIEIDPETGDVWTTYSSLPVGKRDVEIYGTESANNMIVRLRPGDYPEKLRQADKPKRLRTTDMAGRLEGKVAVVTGAGSGMGWAIVERFCREGARVVAVDISGKQNALAQQLGSSCLPFQADVSSTDDVQAMLAAAMEHFGQLNVLCNNAAIQGTMRLTAEYDVEEFDRVMAVNTRSVFLGMRYGIPLMLKSGGGSIVNTASMASKVAFPQLVAYAASKGAVMMMSKNAAVEYADQGIRVNCFCPGSIDTGMTRGMPAEYMEAVINANPVKRIGRPEEIADLALFLASDESSFITGTEILIDGGYTAL